MFVFERIIHDTFYSHTLVAKYGCASSPYISTNNNFAFFIIIIRDALNFFDRLSAVQSNKCSSISIASGFLAKTLKLFLFHYVFGIFGKLSYFIFETSIH